MRWRAPDGIRRGARSTCGRCREILVCREGPVGLEDSHLDPFVRRYGMRSRVLWGWLVGCTLWLPLLLGAWVLRGTVDSWAFLRLAVPCLATVYWLLLRRRGTPAGVWSGYFGLGIGGYLVYLWVLVELGFARIGAGASWAGALGVLGAVVGCGGLIRHASLVRRLPRLDAEWAPSEMGALEETSLMCDPQPMALDHGKGS
jgi:hypothetical protein